MSDILLESVQVAAEPAFSTRSIVRPRPRSGNWSSGEIRHILATAIRIGDPLMIVAGAAAFLGLGGPAAHPGVFVLEVAIAVLLANLLFEKTGLYERAGRDTNAQLPKLALIYCGCAGTLAGLGYLLSFADPAMGRWPLAWLPLSLAFLAVGRITMARLTGALQKAGQLATATVVVGSHGPVRRLMARLSDEIGKSVNIVGVYDLEDDQHPAIFNDLARIARTDRIDEVLIPLPVSGGASLDPLLRALRSLSITVRLLPELPIGSSCRAATMQCGLPAVSVIDRPLSEVQCALKRLEDLVVGGVALAAAAPVMLLAALLIKLGSPGPVLFKQDRWGFNGRRITVFKFRTMRVHNDDPRVTQATRGDKRVTAIGRLLRRTSLDELPQLFNVLQGEMSLVGPRPHAVAHNEQYMALIDDYLARHRVKPGITGLAQVNGYRGITDTLDKMQGRVEYDLRYIESWSLLLDLKLLFKTIFVGFSHRNAF